MSVVISVSGYCKAVIPVLLLSLVTVPVFAAPATAESKIEVKQKPALPSIKTLPAATLKPATIKKSVPLKNLREIPLKPAVRPDRFVPVPQRPAPTGRQTPPVSDTPRPNPTSDSPPVREEVPRTAGEPAYEPAPAYDQGYDQGYDYGGGNDSPGSYSPDYGDDYYQQPQYEEPSPQPFRGVEGSLLEQQQFEFKPLDELSSTTQQKTQDEQLYEPGQVLVATISMDEARQLQQAVASARYRPKSRTSLPQLGFVLTIFRLPADVPVMDAVAQLKEAFPGFLVSANTRYTPYSSDVNKKNYAKSLVYWEGLNTQCAKNFKIGLLDGEIDKGNPQLTQANIQASSVLPAGISKKKSDHATAIANLLVGREQGLLPDAELVAVNVFRNNDGKPDTTTAWILKAINSLLEKNVTLINMSFGGSRDAVLEYVVKTLYEKQVFITAAAGNNGPNGQPVYPAAYPEVIAVTAVDARRKIYRKANRGGYIDIAAPGVDVWSASLAKGQYYSGTSYAVPFVTATLSVLRSQYPAESTEQIKSRLKKLVSDAGKAGKDPTFGWGVLNIKDICSN